MLRYYDSRKRMELRYVECVIVNGTEHVEVFSHEKLSSNYFSE